MPPPLILDPASLDLGKVVADIEAIRRVNPQRFELEQLTAIVHIDQATQTVAGYKEVHGDEFWVRGHMPGYPIFPGVLICEAAAQLCCYYIAVTGQLVGDFLGFGGMENIRFRGPVKPGDRLVLVGKAVKIHRRKTVFSVQGFVGGTMVFDGDIIGMAMMASSGDAPSAEEG